MRSIIKIKMFLVVFKVFVCMLLSFLSRNVFFRRFWVFDMCWGFVFSIWDIVVGKVGIVFIFKEFIMVKNK